GNPGAAADPNSLAGKLLRIDAQGKAAQGNPTAGSAVTASGLTSPGGVCLPHDGSSTWITDQAGGADQLYRVGAGKSLGAPAWSWPDKPGVGGCAVFSNMVMVATSHHAGLQ